MNKICGIYRIDNVANGRFYIGQSIDIVKRERRHRIALQKNLHKNRFLQRAWNKYGNGNFRFSTLLFCEQFELTRYEQAFVDVLSPDYNLYKVCVNSPAGTVVSESTRRKLSLAGKGRVVSEETKRKMSLISSKHQHSEETKKRLSEISRGKTLSDETKRKLSLAHKGNSYAKGYRHTPETRKKMSEFQKAQIKSPEHCRKDSESLKKWWSEHRETDHRRRVRSPEAIAKLIEYNKTRVLSEDTLKKMSDARKAYYAKKRESAM